MQRTLVGAVMMFALAGSQAFASNNGLALADRVSSQAETTNDFLGVPLPLTILGLLILGGFIAVAVNDDGPSSP